MQLRSQRYHHITSLSTRILQRVAIELIDWILDFLHGDFDALKNCSLVCKSWLPAARFHLFHSVTITGRSAGEFLQLLSSRNSTLSSLIKFLRIEGDNRWKYWKLTKLSLNVIASLTALRSLVLWNVDIYNSSTAWIEVLKDVGLRHLTIHNARVDNIPQLLPTVCVFSRLEHLTIRHTYGKSTLIALPSTNSPPTLCERLPLSLRELSIDSSEEGNRQLLAWILLHDPVPPIRMLSIGITGPICGRIVDVLRETVEHLELKLSMNSSVSLQSEEGTNALIKSIDLSQITRLRSLRICVRPPTAFLSIECLLDNLRAPIILSVLFDVYMAFQSTYEQDLQHVFPFGNLSRILARHLDSLTEIVFDVTWFHFVQSQPPPPVLEIEKFLKEAMGYPVSSLVKVKCR